MFRKLGRGVAHHVGGNLVAYLALFVALSGSAVAAAPLLTGARIQDGTINSADLRDRGSTDYPGPSIQGSDLEANSITGQEVDESTLSGVDVATGYVLADGTVNWGTGGMAATVVEPTLFHLTFRGFDVGKHYAVVGQPVNAYADTQRSAFEVIASRDPDLAAAVPGLGPGITVRVARSDGTAVPDGFFVRITEVAGG